MVQVNLTPTSPFDWVDIHYQVNGGLQMNYRMQLSAATWEQQIPGLNAGAVITYSFTYFYNGAGYNSSSYSYVYN